MTRYNCGGDHSKSLIQNQESRNVRKAVYNPTKGTVLLRLNRENKRGNHDIKPIENNSGFSWTLFLADTDLIANVVLHTSLPSKDIIQV